MRLLILLWKFSRSLRHRRHCQLPLQSMRSLCLLCYRHTTASNRLRERSWTFDHRRSMPLPRASMSKTTLQIPTWRPSSSHRMLPRRRRRERTTSSGVMDKPRTTEQSGNISIPIATSCNQARLLGKAAGVLLWGDSGLHLQHYMTCNLYMQKNSSFSGRNAGVGTPKKGMLRNAVPCFRSFGNDEGEVTV